MEVVVFSKIELKDSYQMISLMWILENGYIRACNKRKRPAEANCF